MALLPNGAYMHEAEYSYAFIWLRWFTIGDSTAVRAPIELKNISIFPGWSRDGVSLLLVPEHSLETPQVRGRGCWWQVTVISELSVLSIYKVVDILCQQRREAKIKIEYGLICLSPRRPLLWLQCTDLVPCHVVSQVSAGSLCNSSEVWTHLVLIYGCPIFKWVTVSWLKDMAPGY